MRHVLIVYAALLGWCWDLRALVEAVEQDSTSRDDRSLAVSSGNGINVLFIVADQLRYDALRIVQNSMDVYKDKVKIETPNLDKLAAQGVWFKNTYVQSASCVPARATIRTGCTIERNGMQSNSLVRTWSDNPLIAKKVKAVKTYDQLFSRAGYQCESYGKFHLPVRWLYDYDNHTLPIIKFDSYSLNFESPTFEGAFNNGKSYKAQVDAWATSDNRVPKYSAGQQQNVRSGWPYTPIRLDSRYGEPLIIPARNVREFDVMGVDSLPSNYSQTTYTGTQALLSLQRLAKGDKPWVLSASFENPHPPNVVAETFASMYLKDKGNILVPPSMHVPIDNKLYAEKQASSRERGIQNEAKMQELTAVYYGMVTQVDKWVGILLRELEELQISNRTLVVFTSDHGEFLGAHGFLGKTGFFEEAVRVPLLMRLPGKISSGTVVGRPVSHLDLVATMLDYAGLASRDSSDGSSLRRVASLSAMPDAYEDRFVVAEADGALALGKGLNFMVRHGRFKLMISKLAASKVQDMLFNIQRDPFETTNLLSWNTTSDLLVGKAQHLKCLLLEWMQRNNGPDGYYSDPKFNNGIGRGDITEIRNRRSWPAVDQWVSDSRLEFGRPVLVDGKWRSNAWLYIGRTTEGTLVIKNVSLTGQGKVYFTISRRRGIIERNQHLRIKVSFVSTNLIDPKELKVGVVIESDIQERYVVAVVPWS